MKLKSQYKSAKEETRIKEYELEDIKRNMKFTRMNEHEIEVKTLQGEIENMKNLYEASLLQNKKQTKTIEDLEHYKELYHKIKKTNEVQENLISNLNKQLLSKEEDIRRLSSARKQNNNNTNNSELSLKLRANLKNQVLYKEKSKKSLEKATNQSSISGGGGHKSVFEPTFHDYTDKINHLKEIIV